MSERTICGHERPILFNTEMVKAILCSRKTQTRRLVKNIPLYEPYFEDVDGMPYACDQDGDWHPAVEFSPIQKGDVLYVRETWCALPVSPGGHTRIPERYYYKADPELRPMGWRGNWRPSIHMPKEAARLFLLVKDVRMERLQTISEKDAIAEGITKLFDYLSDEEFAEKIMPYSFKMKKEDFGWTNYLYKRDEKHLFSDYVSPIESFASLWDSTIKEPDIPLYGWESNPWVWVIEFEVTGGKRHERI